LHSHDIFARLRGTIEVANVNEGHRGAVIMQSHMHPMAVARARSRIVNIAKQNASAVQLQRVEAHPEGLGRKRTGNGRPIKTSAPNTHQVVAVIQMGQIPQADGAATHGSRQQ
jgi:hypothetical protein